MPAPRMVLSKATLKRVSSRQAETCLGSTRSVGGLLLWGSSPLWHTCSCSAHQNQRSRQRARAEAPRCCRADAARRSARAQWPAGRRARRPPSARPVCAAWTAARRRGRCRGNSSTELRLRQVSALQNSGQICVIGTWLTGELYSLFQLNGLPLRASLTDVHTLNLVRFQHSGRQLPLQRLAQQRLSFEEVALGLQ